MIPYIFAKTSVSCPKSFYCSSSVHLLKIFYNENQSLFVSDEEQSDIYTTDSLSFLSSVWRYFSVGKKSVVTSEKAEKRLDRQKR